VHQVGLKKGATVDVYDIWAGKSLGKATGSYTSTVIGEHDHVLVKFTPSS
jgi:hypothetical protein